MASLRRSVASDDEEYVSGEEGEIEFSDSSDDDSSVEERSRSHSSARSTQSKAGSTGAAAAGEFPVDTTAATSGASSGSQVSRDPYDLAFT